MRIPRILWASDWLIKTEVNIGTDKFPEWVPARPLPMYTIFERWKAAWLVFTGKADALRWRGQ